MTCKPSLFRHCSCINMKQSTFASVATCRANREKHTKAWRCLKNFDTIRFVLKIITTRQCYVAKLINIPSIISVLVLISSRFHFSLSRLEDVQEAISHWRLKKRDDSTRKRKLFATTIINRQIILILRSNLGFLRKNSANGWITILANLRIHPRSQQLIKTQTIFL